MITAKISYPKGMDFRDWMGWSASRKYFRLSKLMVCRTSRPWQCLKRRTTQVVTDPSFLVFSDASEDAYAEAKHLWV